MEQNAIRNISSNPHVRSDRSTGTVMLDVILALIPATMVGVWHYGMNAFIVVVMSVLACCMTEFVFDYCAHKKNTLKDGSAVVTGLLLALVLPPGVPAYIPLLGGIFAIFFVKMLLGGLGKNFMNPALGARCFLLISFGTIMTNYSVDTITGATPLAALAEGSAVRLNDVYMGLGTGVIGSCTFALLLGGIYLLTVRVIRWHIPVSFILAFALMELALGQCHSWKELVIQIFGGGIILGAFFMATDPVTSPMTENGMLLYGAFTGILCSLFRVYGASADSVSYAIIFANLTTPLIDSFMPVPKPMGVGIEGDQKNVVLEEKKSFRFPKPALVLCAITLVTGAALGGVNYLTRDTIKEQQLLAEAASYLEVVPGATGVAENETMKAAIEGLNGEIYGDGAFGKAYINCAYIGTDDSGNEVGTAISVSTLDGFDGNITLSVGIGPEGEVLGIAFTEINETAGMGMNADTPEWKAQFAGRKVPSFVLNKAGGSTAEDEIDSVTGASITSGAVVNAVNAALDFWAANAQ